MITHISLKMSGAEEEATGENYTWLNHTAIEQDLLDYGWSIS